MKIHQYNEMMRHLTRPPNKFSKEAKKEILDGFYKNRDAKKPMPILKYISKMNELYGNGTEKTSIDERRDSKQVKSDTKVTPKKDKWTYTSWADGLEKRTRPTNKTPETKKILVAKKPTPTKPLKPLEPFYDWRLAPWYEYPEDDDAPAAPADDKKSLYIKTGITKLI